MSEKLQRLRQEIGLDGILAELNPGSLIPHSLVMNALRLLCQEVMPRFHWPNFISRQGAVREDTEMTVQPGRREEDRNPRTHEEARSFIAYVESLFSPWNIDALVASFTEDCVVRFVVIPEFRGREASQVLYGQKCQAEGVWAQKAVSHADERRHDEHLGRRMGRCRHRSAYEEIWR